MNRRLRSAFVATVTAATLVATTISPAFAEAIIAPAVINGKKHCVIQEDGDNFFFTVHKLDNLQRIYFVDLLSAKQRKEFYQFEIDNFPNPEARKAAEKKFWRSIEGSRAAKFIGGKSDNLSVVLAWAKGARAINVYPGIRTIWTLLPGAGNDPWAVERFLSYIDWAHSKNPTYDSLMKVIYPRGVKYFTPSARDKRVLDARAKELAARLRKVNRKNAVAQYKKEAAQSFNEVSALRKLCKAYTSGKDPKALEKSPHYKEEIGPKPGGREEGSVSLPGSSDEEGLTLPGSSEDEGQSGSSNLTGSSNDDGEGDSGNSLPLGLVAIAAILGAVGAWVTGGLAGIPGVPPPPHVPGVN